MRCPKCLLCLSALLTLLGLKVYIEWTSEPRLGKAHPGPRGTPPGPTSASSELGVFEEQKEGSVGLSLEKEWEWLE